MSNKNLSKNILRMRKTLGWTQGELAKKINAAAATVSNIESNKHEPSWMVVCRLAEVFNVSIGELSANQPKTTSTTKLQDFFLKFGEADKLTKKDQALIIEIIKRLTP